MEKKLTVEEMEKNLMSMHKALYEKLGVARDEVLSIERELYRLEGEGRLLEELKKLGLINTKPILETPKLLIPTDKK